MLTQGSVPQSFLTTKIVRLLSESPFGSNADLTGDNPDGNFEIFLATCGSAGQRGKGAE